MTALEQVRQILPQSLGSSEASLLNAYLTLRAEDLTNAWAYYDSHQHEIERQIQDNDIQSV
ncbi:MAG: hypothetical protein AAF614_25020 [Chloroflexota bacterium]